MTLAVRPWIGITFFIATTVAAGYYGDRVPAETQANMLTALQATAAIIFGVVGVWLALVYPEALQQLSDLKTGDGTKQSHRVRVLLVGTLVLTISLILSLVIMPIGAVITNTSLFAKHPTWFLRTSFALCVAFSLIQCWVLLLTLYPLSNADDTARRAAAQKQNRLAVMRQASSEHHDPGRPSDT
jgi:cytochrome bd-type quinol oxidase subunit 2